MKNLTFICDKSEKIAQILCKKGFSYNYACKLLRGKDVKVCGVRIKDNILVQKGDEVSIFYDEEGHTALFDIVFQDENIVVINKKAGIEVEGADGLEGKIQGARAVHRLDRNTQGLMVMAMSQQAESALLQAFKRHEITKKYIAEVVGPTNFNGIYTAYLGKDAENSMVRIFSNPGRGRQEIKTGLRTIKSNPSSSLVECDLLTGKTHQIRAHLAYLGHPIIGDGKYGRREDNKKFKRKTQALYCYYLKLAKFNGPLEYLSEREFKVGLDKITL